jgi:hypothetical protein
MLTRRISNMPSPPSAPSHSVMLDSEEHRPFLHFQHEPGKGVSHVQLMVGIKSERQLFVFYIPTHQFHSSFERGGLTSPSKISNALTSMIVSPETNVPRVVYSSSSN